jgi:hypothetical protein
MSAESRHPREVIAQSPTQSSVEIVQFAKFKSLPPELRLNIWEFALLRGQLISMTYLREQDFNSRYYVDPFKPKWDDAWYQRKKGEKPAWRWYGSYCSPALLRVNREARRVALKSYQLLFQNGATFFYPIYIDPIKDTIHIQRISDLRALDYFKRELAVVEDFKKIMSLSLSEKITRKILNEGCSMKLADFSLSLIFEEIYELDLLCDGEPWDEETAEEAEYMEEEALWELDRCWEIALRRTRAKLMESRNTTPATNLPSNDAVSHVQSPEEDPSALPLIGLVDWEEMKEFGMTPYHECEEDIHGSDWIPRDEY